MSFLSIEQSYSYFRSNPEARKRYKGLVGCGKAKKNYSCKAKNLYTGGLTKAAISWMDRNCEVFRILSAKHFLLNPDKIISPYNLKITDLSEKEKKQWKQKTRDLIEDELGEGPFLILAGSDYIKTLGTLKNSIIICNGLNLFQRTSWLKKNPILTDDILRCLK